MKDRLYEIANSIWKIKEVYGTSQRYLKADDIRWLIEEVRKLRKEIIKSN